MPDNNGVTKADLTALEERLNQRFVSLFNDIHNYIDERTRDMQTELLRGFRAYEEGATIRMAKLAADVSNIDLSTDKRLAIVEQRLFELEQRIAGKGL